MAKKEVPFKKVCRPKGFMDEEAKKARLPTIVRNAPEDRNPNKPLTEKAKLFVKEWASGETIRSAAARAGYNDGGSTGYLLSRTPSVIAMYEKEKALYEASCQMTRKKVMDGFLEAADMARTLGDPVALTGAWREVGKMCGYYEPVKRSIEVNLSGNVTMKKLESASDAELLKLIKGEVEDVVFREIEEEGENE